MQPRPSNAVTGIAAAVCLSVGLCLPSARAEALGALEIIPKKFVLHGQAARQQLLIETLRDNNFHGQITNGFVLESSDPKIVKIENGMAKPVADGTATLSAKVGGQTATAQVSVEAMGQSSEWSFRNAVQPVLSKA